MMKSNVNIKMIDTKTLSNNLLNLFERRCSKIQDKYVQGVQNNVFPNGQVKVFAGPVMIVKPKPTVSSVTITVRTQNINAGQYYKFFSNYGTGIYMAPGWTPQMTEEGLAQFQPSGNPPGRAILRPGNYITGRGSEWYDYGYAHHAGARFMRWPDRGWFGQHRVSSYTGPKRKVFYSKGYWYADITQGQKATSPGAPGKTAKQNIPTFTNSFLNNNLMNGLLNDIVKSLPINTMKVV